MTIENMVFLMMISEVIMMFELVKLRGRVERLMKEKENGKI
jgi:hypothetical protein